MRTTIDLPPDLRRRLAEEAAARNQKGYSRLIVEALRLYLASAGRDRQEIVRRLKGSLSRQEARREMTRIRALRGNWRR